MSIDNDNGLLRRPSVSIHVLEGSARGRKGWTRCQLNRNIAFTTSHLESYCIAKWEPIVYDAMVVAAAVEFADKSLRRSKMSWPREFHLVIPVHKPNHWNAAAVLDALHDVLNFLTGDTWTIEFCKRRRSVVAPEQGQFDIPSNLNAVIPFSEGLDSRCVAGLLSREMGDTLIRVRLGSQARDGQALRRARQPFTSIPYEVKAEKGQFVESSARSRGFKFAVISGLAAYLVKAGQIIVSESGQGALGPALVTVGQSYEDYRSHPLFTERMEKFLEALFHHKVQFIFPQIWNTKAETLRKFAEECNDGKSWESTWSCWQQSRHVGVEGKKRQCGICAACLLRRLSVHAAGLRESKETYVWENLSAREFFLGAATAFDSKKITGALREYAIAGALHLEHLAQLLASRANVGTLSLCAFQVGQSLGPAESDVRPKLDRLLAQHGKEWKDFMNSLGKSSFLNKWARGEQS